MKTIAIANQKGGTGKTITAYNLGIVLTQQGYRVLMVGKIALQIDCSVSNVYRKRRHLSNKLEGLKG